MDCALQPVPTGQGAFHLQVVRIAAWADGP
jgi:hypothetical protein